MSAAGKEAQKGCDTVGGMNFDLKILRKEFEIFTEGTLQLVALFVQHHVLQY